MKTMLFIAPADTPMRRYFLDFLNNPTADRIIRGSIAAAVLLCVGIWLYIRHKKDV